MEGIFNVKQRLRRLEQRFESLVLIVSTLEGTQQGAGAPADGTTGKLYYDTVGRNLYFNEGTNAAPSWVLIA